MEYNITSEKSAEQSVAVGLGGQISNIIPEIGTTEIRLSWTKSHDASVRYYYVYYSTSSPDTYDGIGLGYIGNTNPTPLESPIMVPVVGNIDTYFNPETPSILITDVIVGMPYWFSIAAIDSEANSTSKVPVVDVHGDPINITTRASGASVEVFIPTRMHAIVTRTSKGIALTWQYPE